jgi:hypothetical protein
MADGIYTAVDAVEPTGGDSALDLSVRVSDLSHLLCRDDAVLSLGQPRQSPVRTHFWSHTDHKCVRTEILPLGNICSVA